MKQLHAFRSCQDNLHESFNLSRSRTSAVSLEQETQITSSPKMKNGRLENMNACIRVVNSEFILGGFMQRKLLTNCISTNVLLIICGIHSTK